MAQREKEAEFVVTDRRKFRFDGEPIPQAERPEAESERPVKQESQTPAEPEPAPAPVAAETASAVEEAAPEVEEESAGEQAPQGPSTEDLEASQQAYQATAERMDDIVRANNPGAPHEGPATFDRVIQSLYVTAIVQLGLNTPAGQQMRVDLLGARNSIDMLAVVAEKTKGNTTPEEDKLLQSALFELRMSFLEMTQVLAQNAQAAAKGTAPTLAATPGKITL